MYPQPTQIFVSKSKTTLLLIGSLMFVGLGIWLSSDPQKFANNRYNPTIVLVVSILCVLFFSVCAIVALAKMFQKHPAYVLNEDGLVLDSRKPDVATIPWSDIKAFPVLEINRTKLILVDMKNPEQFIEKQLKGFKKRMMYHSLKNYQSPVSLTSSSLQIKHKELLDLLNQYHLNYHKSTPIK